METVWVRDITEGFVLGKITELMGDGAEVLPLDPKYPRRVCSFDDIFKAGDLDKDVDDNCEMMFLNEATLLNNIQRRYYKNKIYSYVANILIAVNPYKEIPELYSKATMAKYHGKSVGELPPHVFAIADKAARDIRVLKQSQSIIVSGESGAGKTESTKHLLRFLCDNRGSGSEGPIEDKILDANPVLEAFGNAKTTRNNNSSRFGKFIEVHYDKKFSVVGGYISHYLLEKSRICSASGDERCYHIFYILLGGAPESLRQQLSLTQPDHYNYLKGGCTRYFTKASSDKKLSLSQKSAAHAKQGGLRDTVVDDVEGFNILDKALATMGVGDKERLEIYSTVAAVLHLGNVQFEEISEDTRGGSRVSPASEKSLAVASKLLGIDADELRQALVSRVMQSNRGGFKGTVIMVPLKVYEANNARDALAKAVYSKLFDYIVQRINQSIPFQASSYYIGVLDIAGFEFFTVNSFEQFCINYCNEKLQQFFNEKILKYEQELYKREGLNVPEIKFVDNQDCIDTIEAPKRGIFTLLDEESKMPKPSFQHFTSEIHSQWANSFRLGLPRSSRLQAHRNIRDDEGFLVRHFAGAVCYQTVHFIEKNNDALHASLEGIVQESKNKLIQSLFANQQSAQKGKLTFISVGNKFKTQLAELMEKLRNNGTNFIRCIKPNSKMIDQKFDGALSLMQLKCSGMVHVLELMEHGYPSRAPFGELHSMYVDYLPSELKKLQPKVFCEAMIHSLNLHEKDFKFGITRVFFRPGKYSEFDTIMRSDPENLKNVVTKVKKWLVKSRWLKLQYGAYAVIKLKNRIIYRKALAIKLQAYLRGFIAKKKYLPRLKGLRDIRSLHSKVKQMEITTQQVKKNKDSVVNEINKLKTDFAAAIDKIKKEDKISAKEIEKICNNLETRVNTQMTDLQKKVQQEKIAEEQERLRKIQEEMEQERKRKEEEERKKKEEEEIRRKKAEIEARRKQEEEERKKQEEADRKKALELQAEAEKTANEERELKERLEQERQDHELALRLAQESNGQVEESPPIARNGGLDSTRSSQKLIRSEAVRNQQAAMSKSKYDLSKWKYSDLRDTINTSCDIDLLEACRHEFHRRLKVYHAWKAKNNKRTVMDENERAPRSVMDAAQKTPKIQPKAPIIGGTDQRYFRIPFTRPGVTDSSKRGWWYAHFDGQYVARQMELHPEKPPILLVAGKDDMQMCELSLEETGLTRKRGAEILEHEFNKEWDKNGGKAFIKPIDRKR